MASPKDNLFGSKIKEEPIDYDEEDEINSDEYGYGDGFGDPYEEDDAFMQSKFQNKHSKMENLVLSDSIFQVILRAVKTILMEMISMTMTRQSRDNLGDDIGNVEIVKLLSLRKKK